MTKDEWLAAFESYEAEDLALALQAADASRRAREEPFYVMHYLVGETLALASDGAGDVTVTMPVSRLILNPVGMTHGGMLAFLCDNVMGLASYQRARRSGVTLELTVRFHQKAVGTLLTARGRVIAETAQFNTTQCEVYDDQGVMVASATGTFYHRRRDQRTKGMNAHEA